MKSLSSMSSEWNDWAKWSVVSAYYLRTLLKWALLQKVSISPVALATSLSGAHLWMWSFWAKSCQSLPLALAVSKVVHIRWRMDRGILKALAPVCEVTVQSACIKNGTVSFSLWKNKKNMVLSKNTYGLFYPCTKKHRVRINKQGKLTWDHNPIKVLMGG